MNNLNNIPKQVLDVCKKRKWSLHWTSRGAYLHLESSELIEAIRGKKGNSTDEASDVLFVLMSITENAGIPFTDVVNAMLNKIEYLKNAPRYKGEEYSGDDV